MAQQVTNGNTPRAVRFLGGLVRDVSRVPQELHNVADQLNDKMINVAQGIQGEKDRTAAAVESNLKQTKMEQLWTQGFRWLQKPTNLILVFLGFVAFVIFVRKA